MRVGEHNIQTEADEGHEHQDVLIASRISHEAFDSVSFRNDIAILKLAKRVRYTGRSRP